MIRPDKKNKQKLTFYCILFYALLGTIILREKTELKLNMGAYNGPIYTCSNINIQRLFSYTHPENCARGDGINPNSVKFCVCHVHLLN